MRKYHWTWRAIAVIVKWRTPFAFELWKGREVLLMVCSPGGGGGRRGEAGGFFLSQYQTWMRNKKSRAKKFFAFLSCLSVFTQPTTSLACISYLPSLVTSFLHSYYSLSQAISYLATVCILQGFGVGVGVERLFILQGEGMRQVALPGLAW